MLMPKKDRRLIFEFLFKEGVLVAKHDMRAAKHPEIPEVRNLFVIKAMQVRIWLIFQFKTMDSGNRNSGYI